MFRIKSSTGESFPIALNPVSIYDFERNLEVVRQEGETATFLRGDKGVKPFTIKLAVTHAFADIGAAQTYLAGLRNLLDNGYSLIYDLNFEMPYDAYRLTYETLANAAQYKVLLEVFPLSVRDLNGVGQLTWGDTLTTLGDTIITMGQE